MASGIYNVHKGDLMKKNIDLENDDIKVMLLDNNHTFSDTDSIIGDVDSNEISGTNYTAGGESLTNKNVSVGSTTAFDASDVSWSSASITAYHAVLYNNTTNNLICSFDFGGEKSVTDGVFTIEWGSNGILALAS